MKTRKIVTSIQKKAAQKLEIVYEDRSSDTFDCVVLALGFPKQKFSLLNPHTETSYSNLLDCESIAIVGSGLTALDVIEKCKQQSYTGKIHVISRSAKFPYSHANKKVLLNEASESKIRHILRSTQNLLDLEKKLRALIIEFGMDSVFDSLRPLTNNLWSKFSARDQLCFFRHLESRWNRARHRMPPRAWDDLQALISDGKLVLYSGSFTGGVEIGKGKIEVSFSQKGVASKIKVDQAFDCRGPSSNAAHNPLIQQLLRDNLLSLGPLCRGIETDFEGKVKNAEIFVVGPMRRQQCLESTAVRELREQAKAVAGVIIRRVAQNSF